ncbi:putative redox protein [Deinobacterium chartae]|uniref:Putative redox protein n=1 Tax=Deinobacterium chartae TaxID=521158 RepID=A0A841I2B7_9DEIO|nr:OsmC family protein [Deinobacterium chartae]MBB6098065.1 putative redox protein [Deinobacterium chartae]
MATKRIVMHHLGGQRYLGHGEAGGSLVIDADHPPIGVRPMEALLGALATCTAFDVVEIMNKRKTPLTSYRVEVEGDRAETYPQRYTHIRVKHIASGPGVTVEQLEKAAQLSHEKYCSVAASLNAEISLEVELEAQPAQV